MPAKLTLDKGDLILTSPFNRGLVEAIKALPYHDRNYMPATKQWRIKYQWGSDVAAMCKKHLGENITVPSQITHSADYIQTRLFKIEYIGSIRERDNGDMTATGFSNGGWNVIFPADTLTSWFNQEQKPDEMPTFYAVLGIKRRDTLDEIKKAYRISARTWHPDVNKEHDAANQFIKIQQAYEVLSNEMMRRKYDAGLILERDASKSAAKRQQQIIERHGWQPPIRCGNLAVEGTETLGRFLVQKILAWNEIQNEYGQTMVSYWPAGSDNFKIEWL
jgi:hypothetical protein